jgi:tetratricopeptide (TPR) repeat protein
MLNYTQQQILQAYLNVTLLEDDDYLQLHPSNALHILKSIIDDAEFKDSRNQLRQINMLETCVQLRSVLRHECPQNVNHALDSHNGFVTYKDFNGTKKTEKQGLLGLSAKNDSTAEPVTKRDVTKFIVDTIEREISYHNRSLKRENLTRHIEKHAVQHSSDSSDDSDDSESDAPVTHNMWKALEGLNTFSPISGKLYNYYENDLKQSLTASQAANFQLALAEMKNKYSNADHSKLNLLLLQYANNFIQFYCIKEYDPKPFTDLLEELKEYYREDETHRYCSANMMLLCLYHRGVCYDHIGVFDSALEDFNMILKKDAAFAIAYFHRGKCHYELGDYSEAKKDLDNCSIMCPTNADIYYYKGLCLMKKKKYEKALDQFSKAIDLDDHDYRFYSSRGDAYFGLKNYNTAIENFDKAISMNKSDPQTYYGRGMCFKNISAYKQAIADLTSCIDLNPRHKQAYFARGSCYITQETHQKAIADWTVVINLDSSDTTSRYWRGISFYRTGVYDQALSDFLIVTQQDPLNARAYNYLGCCYSLRHHYDEAITNFKAALNLDPSLARAYYNLARCYYNKGELKEALEQYNLSIARDPNHANSYGGRAQVYDRLEDEKSAIVDIRQALALEPKNEVFRKYKIKFESKMPKKNSWIKKTVHHLNPIKKKKSSSA